MFGCFAWLKKTGCNNEGDLITEMAVRRGSTVFIFVVTLPTIVFGHPPLIYFLGKINKPD